MDGTSKLDFNTHMTGNSDISSEKPQVIRAPEPTAAPGKAHWFTTTHWSVVLAAGQQDPARCLDALEKLCRTYWYPLYAYVRRKGFTPDDAQDATQSFFEYFLEKGSFAKANQTRGKFRSFLLASLDNFLKDRTKYTNAQKRGAGQPVISIDEASAEQYYNCEPLDTRDPARAYERDWAMTVLTRSLDGLKAGLQAEGRAERFEDLKPFLLEEEDADYTQVATKLGMSVGAARTAVSRLRDRFRDLLVEEISHTVDTPEEVEAEINYLISVFSG